METNNSNKATLAIVIRDIPYLKLLAPIISELNKRNITYIVYGWNAPRGDKEYIRVSPLNLSVSFLDPLSRVKFFSSDSQLYNFLKEDGIEKLLSVEIGLWANLSKLKELKIKTYSIQYLSDSLWKDVNRGLHRVYFSTQHLLNCYLDFHKLKQTSNFIFLGSPLFDSINSLPNQSHRNRTLVLMPNVKSNSEINNIFGGENNFREIIKTIREGSRDPLILKSRKKQWLPGWIKDFGELYQDDPVMYPTTVSHLVKQAQNTIMFFSSGIYEAVGSGSRVINIPIKLGTWNWKESRLKKYFSLQAPALYNFTGVVDSVSLPDVLSKKWKFRQEDIKLDAQRDWVKTYIGQSPGPAHLSILEDVLKN